MLTIVEANCERAQKENYGFRRQERIVKDNLGNPLYLLVPMRIFVSYVNFIRLQYSCIRKLMTVIVMQFHGGHLEFGIEEMNIM